MELQEREKRILESIVRNYINSAVPIGSRAIAKSTDLGISPATIRNVMMDLEEAGLITQPHTSAGRIPTDKGYRVYVDHLIKFEDLTPQEITLLQNQLDTIYHNVDEVLKNTSAALSRLSFQFTMVLAPKVNGSTVERVEMLRVSSDKILVMITFKAGLINSLILAMDTDIPADQKEDTCRILNERLAGLSIKEIQDSIALRLKNVSGGNARLLKIIVNSAPQLFQSRDADSIYCDGATLVTNQPEFEDRKNVEAIIYLLEHKELLADILNVRSNPKEKVTVTTIGDENPEQEIQSFSVITTSYHIGDEWGVMGIIGPKRMRYSRLIPLISFTSNIIDRVFED